MVTYSYINLSTDMMWASLQPDQGYAKFPTLRERFANVVLSSIVPTTERFPLGRFILGKMSNPSLFRLIAALISPSTIKEFCSSQ